MARFRGAEMKATRRPKSPEAASISVKSIRAPCNLVYTGTFSSAESYWMHSARSGATIFFGRGPRAARRVSERHMQLNENEESSFDDDSGELDEEFPLGDGTADSEATVSCPY